MPKCKKSDYVLSGKIVGEMVGEEFGRIAHYSFKFFDRFAHGLSLFAWIQSKRSSVHILCHIR